MGVGQTMQDLVEDLADLFGDAEEMDELDAADFKDNAGKIWELRQRAKDIVESY